MAVWHINATFAANMRSFNIFLLSFLISCLTIQTEAQEALYVYGQGVCNAVDLHNIDEIRVTEDTVDISMGVRYRCADVDSITFRESNAPTGRIGWWGDTSDGSSACYYQSFQKDFPDMVFEASDGICTSAFYYLPNDDSPSSAPARHRVGRKWRYVKNTLSRRRKFLIHHATANEGLGATKMDDDGRIYMDMSDLFRSVPTAEAKKAVNLWYHPQDTTVMPKAPLFGTIERQYIGKSQLIRYDVPMKGVSDSIRCVITFQTDYDGMVRGDSMAISFPDYISAENEFELLPTDDDDSTLSYIIGNTIYIIEEFEATINDVMRWLIRFDTDACKPAYIPEEE